MAFNRCHFNIGSYSCLFFKINHHDPLVMFCCVSFNVAAPLQTPMAPSTTICWLPSEEDVATTTHCNWPPPIGGLRTCNLNTFCEWVGLHHNCLRPNICVKRPLRSLETKWDFKLSIMFPSLCVASLYDLQHIIKWYPFESFCVP